MTSAKTSGRKGFVRFFGKLSVLLLLSFLASPASAQDESEFDPITAGAALDELVAMLDEAPEDTEVLDDVRSAAGEIVAEAGSCSATWTEERTRLEERYALTDLAHRTGGPARYVRAEETGQQIGFITPLTHNFCESCNRVRITCTGEIYMCLGQEDVADLRAPMRASSGNELLNRAIDEAIGRKPKGHDFVIDRTTKTPAVSRHMSVTGG